MPRPQGVGRGEGRAGDWTCQAGAGAGITVGVADSGPAGHRTYLDEVVLTATAPAGWVFECWSGDIESTDNPVEVVIEGDTAIVATFSEARVFIPLVVAGY